MNFFHPSEEKGRISKLKIDLFFALVENDASDAQ